MKKRASLPAIVLALSLLFTLQNLLVSDANPLPWFANPQMTISIQSPENGTINSLPVLVNFTSRGDNQFSVSDDPSETYVRSFFYVLDNQDMATMGTRFKGTNTTTIYENGRKEGYYFNGQVSLTNLADGAHYITVYYGYGPINKSAYVGGTSKERIIYNPTWQATAQFYVDSKLDSNLTPTPSPTPSQIMPTINTGATLPVELNSSTIYIILAFVIVIVAGASISLVYFKRRKGKP
jgi:hypothetical protein